MEAFGETARSNRVRIVLSTILYVIGVAGLIFVAIQEQDIPGSSVNYWLLYVGGMFLVVVASLLFPVPRGSEAPNGEAEDDEGSV